MSETDPFTPKVAPKIREYAQLQGGVRVGKIIPPFDTPVRIEHLPAYQVVFLRRKGPYNCYGSRRSGIRDGFRAVITQAQAQGVLTADSIAIGVGRNSPRLTRPEHCLYDICISVTEHVADVQNLDVQTIDEGRFAILSVDCPTYQIAEYWNWLSFDWLPHSGETLGLGSSFERHNIAEILSNPIKGRVDLCLRLSS
ncbi:GyrI-like domain-containing protein [Roseovarius sp. EL26]|uniref:AraC family transcriptional regulator n=1 Tax=Roseovarius sp. EL26 TaxID=2126672 RepID=UPI0020B163B1|nr:GyrI-like domain-containing protein [Roseovarius sp. EL26]